MFLTPIGLKEISTAMWLMIYNKSNTNHAKLHLIIISSDVYVSQATATLMCIQQPADQVAFSPYSTFWPFENPNVSFP